MMQQIQNYNRKDFDENGFNAQGEIFTDLIARWEREFHTEFKPFYANQLSGNYATMQLINKCFRSDRSMHFGMDGDYDFETNLEVAKKGSEPVVFALGSCLPENEDEPLFLVEDASFADGVVILKYVPEEGGEDEDELPVTGIEGEIRVLLK